MSSSVRIAVIGLGNMGTQHVRTLSRIDGVTVTALCDSAPGRADAVATELKQPVPQTFTSAKALWQEADAFDAVIIAVPHYDHVPLALQAMKLSRHVLIEKPIAVHGVAARELLAGIENLKRTDPHIHVAAMFNQRTWGHWQTIQRMIAEGSLGKLVRASWIITDWFRTQHYYNIGGWRATWAGEGGGVLLNQCPHNLDLYQWFFGMPQRVRGFAGIARYHTIEVEDEVTAYFEHENGMVGHFITSTGESPGTNRLEIVGELGKLVYEDGALTFWRNDHSMLQEIAESQQAFVHVEHQRESIPFHWDGTGGHEAILRNFVAAIRGEEPLIAPAEEGLNSVLLANGIMQSSFDAATITYPMDEQRWYATLQKLIETSTFHKPPAACDQSGPTADFNTSF
jgi:predicted dehydrogenase